MPKVPKIPSSSTVRITRRALYDRDVVDARDRLELRGGRRKHDARRLCPNLTAPARRRSWGGVYGSSRQAECANRRPGCRSRRIRGALFGKDSGGSCGDSRFVLRSPGGMTVIWTQRDVGDWSKRSKPFGGLSLVVRNAELPRELFGVRGRSLAGVVD